MRRGVDRGSVAIYMLSEVHPTSWGVLSKEKLNRAIIRLNKSEVDHNLFGGDNQIVGKSIIVGITIFSIVTG